VLGLSDVVIRNAQDLSGNQFVIIEIAGANEEEVENILSKQGKFEAKIDNKTVFKGGKEDITFVCRSAQCSGIDPQRGCVNLADGYSCGFYFQITIGQEAADRMADITRDLQVVYEGGASYLSKDIEFYLDDTLVDSLRIGSSLKGQSQTEIQISGGGAGFSLQEARNDMNTNMKRLQTILITGSLPVNLKIIKSDTLSPSLGQEFLSNALLISILAILAVTAIVIFRYRKIKIAIPIITVITSEILLILGVAALLKQNLDIAGIAGIIVAIGTGVDDQIVITDETIGKHSDDEYKYLSFGQRVKKAFFIVIAAYVATVASMVPLLFAGAGLLKGFAVTTIIGVTNGVFITRPAFAEMIKVLVGDED
jgi:preprotein translocase subunit SecD